MRKTRHWVTKRGEGQGIKWIHANVSFSGDECLIWPLSRRRGYAILSHLGKNHSACRFMCGLVHGDAPSPEHQCAHSCGRGHEGCVNPRHLSWKTPSENQRDRRLHGTTRHGAPWTLKEEDIAQIRAVGRSKTQAELAAQFGCTEINISQILNRKTWRTGKRSPGGFAVKPFNRHARREKADNSKCALS